MHLYTGFPGTAVLIPNWSCRWDPLLPYNNLPPIPGEQLTTRAVEWRCKLAAAAVETLHDATSELTDPYALFQRLVSCLVLTVVVACGDLSLGACGTGVGILLSGWILKAVYAR